jgi:hypothetical protein
MPAASTIRPNSVVTQDLPWGVGEEANRAAAETVRQRSTHRMTDHGQQWLMIGSTSAAMQGLVTQLRRLGLLATDEDPTTPEGAHNRKVKEESGVGAALIRAWYRFGRRHSWNVKNLTDNVEATNTWDFGRFARVHPDLWDRIFTGSTGRAAAWDGSQDRFVYLIGGNYPTRDLLIDRIGKRLQAAGHLPAGRMSTVAFTSTGQWKGGDDGPFVRALRHLWEAAGSNPDHWPSGYNFGPTEGNNLRVHPALLDWMSHNLLPGERRHMNQLSLKVIGPVQGGFPKVQ